MLLVSLCLCFLFTLAPLTVATPGLDELEVDQSCKNFGNLGDVTADLNQAYKDAKMIAKDAYTRIDSLRKTLAGQNGLLSNTEILRLERLLAAFFIGPFRDAHQAPLGRVPDNNPGYETTSNDLLESLNLIDSLPVGTMPPMFCGPPILTQDEAENMSAQQKKGKWVKITKIKGVNGAPDTDVIDPKTGKSSFYYEDYLNPANIARTNVLVIGEDPCASGALAATKESVNDRWILWCPNKFSQIIRPIPVANTPAQHTDYSTFGYRLTAKRTLNYWRTSLADTMLHEMHHVYVETSTDVIVKIQYPSQRQIAAYGYAGTTQLAENVRVSGNWAQLKMNADSMAIWAIAAYLDGSDWSLGNANGLKDLKDVVVSPPPGGLPRRTAMPGDDGLYQSSQLEAVTRRAEKRFAEKRARAADRYAIGTALGMPGSLVGGREI